MHNEQAQNPMTQTYYIEWLLGISTMEREKEKLNKICFRKELKTSLTFYLVGKRVKTILLKLFDIIVFFLNFIWFKVTQQFYNQHRYVHQTNKRKMSINFPLLMDFKNSNTLIANLNVS